MSDPSGLSRKQVQRVLAEARRERSIASRVEIFSRHFLGCPYSSSPLIGSADLPEVFTVSLEAFDCVTYIETVLALAHTTTVDGFLEWLRKIRYEGGRMEWKRRNHYMTAWMRNNIRDGTVGRIPASMVPTVTRERNLNILPGILSRHVSVKSVPKSAIP